MNEVQKYMLDSIENNEFDRFLRGENPYNITNKGHLQNLETPQDYLLVLKGAVYPLYESGEVKIDELLKDTLIAMCREDAFSIYCAIEVFRAQLFCEKKGYSPFEIDRQQIAETMRIEIKNRKDELTKCFKWEGLRYDNGVYGYVLKVNDVFQKKFSLNIL